jgi:hypothetical protein
LALDDIRCWHLWHAVAPETFIRVLALGVKQELMRCYIQFDWRFPFLLFIDPLYLGGSLSEIHRDSVVMMSSPGNPLEYTHKANPPDPVSQTVYSIAGIQTTVYGLSELPEHLSDLAVLWLLHPRLKTERSMAPIAAQTIHHWNSRFGERAANATRNPVKGLIAVSFDHRNHGTRMADKLANEAWKQGNPRHAQDMYSIYRMSKSCQSKANFSQPPP